MGPPPMRAGSGYVYSLDGEEGTASYDFSAIDWTDTLASSCVSYAHTNSAGQIDVLLLNSVTGNNYRYGRLALYTEQDGIEVKIVGIGADTAERLHARNALIGGAVAAVLNII